MGKTPENVTAFHAGDHFMQSFRKTPPSPYSGVTAPLYDRRPMAAREGNLFSYTSINARVRELISDGAMHVDGLSFRLNFLKSRHFGITYHMKSHEAVRDGVVLARRVEYKKGLFSRRKKGEFEPIESLGIYVSGDTESEARLPFGLELTRHRAQDGSLVDLYAVVQGENSRAKLTDTPEPFVYPKDIYTADRELPVVAFSLGAPNWTITVQEAFARSLLGYRP
jgi:hypothetical protein